MGGNADTNPTHVDLEQLFDRVTILHDGETCTTKYEMFFNVDATKLWRHVIREAVEIAIGRVLPDQFNIPNDKVRWFLATKTHSRKNIPECVLHRLQDMLVQVLYPGNKDEAVDGQIKNLLDWQIEDLQEENEEQRQEELIVILGADKDYYRQFAKIVPLCPIVMIHTGGISQTQCRVSQWRLEQRSATTQHGSKLFVIHCVTRRSLFQLQMVPQETVIVGEC